MNIILDTPITIETVYNNLIGNGNGLKMFNSELNAEVNWYPEDGKIEMNSIINDEIYNEILPLKSFDGFRNEFPLDGWYYGYIND